MSKKKYIVKLSDDECHYLENYINKGIHSSRSIKRAKALLLASTEKTDEIIAKEVGYKTYMTIHNIRQRFCLEGLESALHDKPRSGRPSILDGRAEARLTLIACSEAPGGRVRWTLRLLADKLVELELVDSISHTAVGNILKKTT